MTGFQAILRRITTDVRYLKNLDEGLPRPGHPEGTIRAHIDELESNLGRLRLPLAIDDFWKLKILIHTHDTFKPQAELEVPIVHPESHASLARNFLAEFTDDADLLSMVQYHDEPYALWRQHRSRGTYNRDRLDRLINRIEDWNLFLAFVLIDGCTAAKSRDSLDWFFGEISGRVESFASASDISSVKL